MRQIALATAAVVGVAGSAAAGGFAPAGSATGVTGPVALVAQEPTPLEWLRYVHPREGRNVVVSGNGVRIPTIEWRHPVEVRVRTESGAALTEREKVAIRELALVCDRGEIRDVTEHTEPNGTYVIEYGCAWLQGFDGR